MAETREKRCQRLMKEGRYTAYQRRMAELEASRPVEITVKDWQRKVNSALEDEYGQHSFEREQRQRRSDLLEGWRKVLRSIPAKQRAKQAENYEWAMSHLSSLPGDVDGEPPSRSAVQLLLNALETAEGLKKFQEMYQRATAPRAGTTPVEWIEEEISRFDWLGRFLKEAKRTAKERAEGGELVLAREPAKPEEARGEPPEKKPSEIPGLADYLASRQPPIESAELDGPPPVLKQVGRLVYEVPAEGPGEGPKP